MQSPSASAGRSTPIGSSTPLARATSAVRLRPISPNAAAATAASPPPPTSADRTPKGKKANHTNTSTSGNSARRHGSVSPSGRSRPSMPPAQLPIPPLEATVTTTPTMAFAPLTSVLAPHSLDSYLLLQNQQAQSGLEVVYGLKVELSRFYEELIDRAAAQDEDQQWGAPLPYRIMGEGGVLYWTARREEQQRRMKGTPEERQAEAALLSAPPDPYATHLATLARPPPPVSPETILPAYVVLNQLKLAVRTALGRYEDQVEDLREEVRECQRQVAELQDKLRRKGEGLSANDAPALDKQLRASGGPRSKNVLFADDVSNNSNTARSRSASPRPPPRSSLSSPLSSLLGSPSSGRSLKSPKSPHPKPSIASVLQAAADAMLGRANANNLTARIASVAASPRSSAAGGGGGGWGTASGVGNVNTVREEQLQRRIDTLEAQLVHANERYAQLQRTCDEQELAHSKEIVELTSKLEARESLLQTTRTELTSKAVLLNVEAIARRHRAEARQALEVHFAQQLDQAEQEVKVLMDPRRELLFVRREERPLGLTSPSSSTTPVATVAEVKTARGGGGDKSALSSARARSAQARKKPAAFSGEECAPAAAATTPPIIDVTNAADHAAADLYPSLNSPLSALSKSLKTPAGKQWLGRMLSPTGSATSTTVKASKASSSSSASSSATFSGHLVPGVSVLATDLLLVLSGLFQQEYGQFAQSSVDLSRSAQWARDLKARHKLIAESDERLDMSVPPPPMVYNVQPTTVDLAALLASIPPASLAYLQAIQRLFLTLYHRLPPLMQQRFHELSQQMEQLPRIEGEAREGGGGGNMTTKKEADEAGVDAVEEAKQQTIAAIDAQAEMSPSDVSSAPLAVVDRSVYLARLELIVSKIQAIASFRGLVMKV